MSPGRPAARPTNITWEGPVGVGTHKVVLGSAPPRMPSIDVETKEEQQIVDGKKLGQREKVKKVKVVLFDHLDTLIGRDPLYLYGGVNLSCKKFYYKI